MTTQQCECRERRLIQRIRSVLAVHQQLQQHATALQVSIDNEAILLQGFLPSKQLKSALEPAVRQAGVLNKIENQVQVAS